MSLTLTVINQQALTPFISLFELADENGAVLPGFEAGAHINIELDALGMRSYSLIHWSHPIEAPTLYQFAVQREDNGTGGSKRMHQLAVGDRVSTSFPINNFSLASGSAPSFLLAGGIGITPMLSMAATLRAQKRDVQFHYSGRSLSVMAFVDKLQDLLGNTLHVHTDDDSPLQLDTLFQQLDISTQVYLCGPTGLMDAARTAASQAGIPSDNIHIELFASPEANDGDTAFEVEIASSGKVFTIPAGETIIDVLEASGEDLIYDCQRGDCGICQTNIISGIPDHRDVVLSDDEKASGNVMQICVSRAKSARLVLDL